MACSPQPFFNAFSNQFKGSQALSNESSPINPNDYVSYTTNLPGLILSSAYLQNTNGPLNNQINIPGLNKFFIKEMQPSKPEIQKLRTQNSSGSIDNMTQKEHLNYEEERKAFDQAFVPDFIEFLQRTPHENYVFLTGGYNKNMIQSEGLVQTVPEGLIEQELSREVSMGNKLLVQSKKTLRKVSFVQNRDSKQKLQHKKESYKEIPSLEDFEETFPQYYISYFYRILEGTCHSGLQTGFGKIERDLRNRFIDFMRMAHKCRTWYELRTYIEVEAYLEMASKDHRSIKESFISFIESFKSLPTYEQMMQFLGRFSINGDVIAQYFMSTPEADGRNTRILSSLLYETISNADVRNHWLSTAVMTKTNLQTVVEMAKDSNKQREVCASFRKVVMDLDLD